jgi:hypothetical protein
MWVRSRARWVALLATLAAAVVIVAAGGAGHIREHAPAAPGSSRASPPPPPRFTAAPPPPRFEEEQRWNALYGKVLSGTGTVADIDAYYQHLRQRSERAVEEAQARLADPGLGERDRGLLELALRMNRQRLAGLPREREAALARQRLQEERRRSWTTMAPRP